MSPDETKSMRSGARGTANRDEPWLPDWLSQVGCAVWVSDPDQRLAYANPQAERVLQGTAEEWIGRPCHELVQGKTADGVALCRRDCCLRIAAREMHPVESQLVRFRDGPSGGWYIVTILPVRAPDTGGLHLVHLAHDVSRMRRVELFLQEGTTEEQLAACEGSPPSERLSPRELQVLTLLAHNVDLKRIAARLFISHATTRNHVQHILAKLGVHSAREAVALHLLFDTAHPPHSPSPSTPRPGSAESSD